MSDNVANPLLERLQNYRHNIIKTGGLQSEGRLTRLVGLTLEAVGCKAPVGSRCLVINDAHEKIEAEVVGFADDKTYLMCTGDTQGLSPGSRIVPTGTVAEVNVGHHLLGRILDGAGNPIDGKGPIVSPQAYSLTAKPINPLSRAPITEPLDVGVRAINSLLTVGRGQRMGLFAGSGVGKSVLLGMMTRYTAADVIVVGLIGERGREVKEFIEVNLGNEGLSRSVVIAAPADESPLMRLHGAMVATAIAEYFRDQGLQVLLLMDSLTRYAQAQREIALSVGEPPATKGYPPSVFAKLPQLVERAGNADHGMGSITAFYTVLVEGDDHNDPIADSARAVLDGHIVLSRRLAESGHFPAIDLEASISRVMHTISDEQHRQMHTTFKHYYSKYQQNYDLINIGAYVDGSDQELDQAIKIMPKFNNFLRQGLEQQSNFADSMNQLRELFTQANDQ